MELSEHLLCLQPGVYVGKSHIESITVEPLGFKLWITVLWNGGENYANISSYNDVVNILKQLPEYKWCRYLPGDEIFVAEDYGWATINESYRGYLFWVDGIDYPLTSHDILDHRKHSKLEVGKMYTGVEKEWDTHINGTFTGEIGWQYTDYNDTDTIEKTVLLEQETSDGYPRRGWVAESTVKEYVAES